MEQAVFDRQALLAILGTVAFGLSSCTSVGGSDANKVYGEEILAAPVKAVNSVAAPIFAVPVIGVTWLVDAGLSGV